MRWLLDEVRDHLDANLSSRVTHLWRRSEERGICSTIYVTSRSKSRASSASSVVPFVEE